MCFSPFIPGGMSGRGGRRGSCSKGDRAAVARRSPARHARVTPPTDDAAAPRSPIRPPCRPRDPHARPWPGREITSGGVTLHVRETPGATDAEAVYVHGLSGSGTNWTDLAGLLAPRATGLAVDLPGFGFTRPPAAPDYTPAGHADALLCFLAGRGRPVHLLGNSLGGAIAIMVAAPTARARAFAHARVARDARPPAGPATGVGPAADPRGAARARGRRARDGLAAMTNRDRIESVVRLCFGDPALAPEHRLAEAVAEIDARGRQPWGLRGVRPHREGDAAQLVARRVAVGGGGQGAGADAGGLGRPRPARRAPAGGPHHDGCWAGGC